MFNLTVDLNITSLKSLLEVSEVMGVLALLGLVLVVIGLYGMTQKKRGIDFGSLIIAMYGYWLYIRTDPEGLLEQIKQLATPLIGSGILWWYVDNQFKDLKERFSTCETRILRLEDKLMK